MTTQEKQQPPCEAEHTPFKMICKSNGTSQYYECMHCGYIDFSEAIDSAKREERENIKKLLPDADSIQSYDRADMLEVLADIHDHIAQLEQSEESE